MLDVIQFKKCRKTFLVSMDKGSRFLPIHVRGENPRETGKIQDVLAGRGICQSKSRKDQ